MAPRPKPGLNKSARERFAEGLNYYSGQGLIQEERARTRANERTFTPSTLTPIPWDPNTTYYHPPDESSRVEAFRYVALEGASGAVGFSGTLFVRFIKYGTPWKYLNVPAHIYQSFASAQSKGRYINSVLNNFPNSRASGDEESTFFVQSQM
jgi:hypothetical protein